MIFQAFWLSKGFLESLFWVRQLCNFFFFFLYFWSLEYNADILALLFLGGFVAFLSQFIVTFPNKKEKRKKIGIVEFER